MGSANAHDLIDAIDEANSARLAGAVSRAVSGNPLPDIVSACFMVAAKAMIDSFLAGTSPRNVVRFSTSVWKSVIEGSILSVGGIEPGQPESRARAKRALGYGRGVRCKAELHFTRSSGLPPGSDMSTLKSATETVRLPEVEGADVDDAIAKGAEHLAKFVRDRKATVGDALSLSMFVAAEADH
jgi:hypothetical protein